MRTTRQLLPLAASRRAAAGMLHWIAHLVLVLGVTPALVAAPPFWELTPYRARVLVAVAPVPELEGTAAADVMAELVEATDRVLGAACHLDVRQATGAEREMVVRRIETLPAEFFAADWNKLDKGIAIGIDATAGGFRIAAREFDCRTRIWSPAEVRVVRQTALLPVTTFETFLAVFAPVARIEFNGQGQPILRLRAAGLPTADPGFHWTEPGDVFLPVTRFNDHEGNPRQNGIRIVPWTFLNVQQRDPPEVVCGLHSGLRHPLRVRLRGRVEQLALAIKRPPAPTRLVLRSRVHPDQPLVGYEVLAHDPGVSATRVLGRTDFAGAFTVPPGTGRLRILYVRNGAALLARLPLVPGWKPAVTAAIPEDDARVRAEGFLAGLEANLLDVVGRREILIARIRHFMKKGDLDAAEKSLDQLQQLPNRQYFQQQIDQEQQRDVSSDAQIQARIEQRFDATKGLLVQHLDPHKINTLQLEFDRLRRPTAR